MEKDEETEMAVEYSVLDISFSFDVRRSSLQLSAYGATGYIL